MRNSLIEMEAEISKRQSRAADASSLERIKRSSPKKQLSSDLVSASLEGRHKVQINSGTNY
jgi:hypothetical protein